MKIETRLSDEGAERLPGGPKINKTEKRTYKTTEGVPVEIACREFSPEPDEVGQEKSSPQKAVVFLPGVGMGVETKSAQSLAEAYARISKSKTYVITSRIVPEVKNSLYEQAAAIAKLIKEKGVAEITLAGVSQGGDKAMDLVSILQKDKDFKINGLVLIDAVGLYDREPQELKRTFFKHVFVDTPIDLVRKKRRNKLSGIKKGLRLGTDVLFGISKDFWRIWRMNPSYKSLKSRFDAEVNELAKINPRAKEIEAPVVLISGAGDPVSDPERLVPAAEEGRLRTEREDTGSEYFDPREVYLKQTLFPKSPYVRMVAPEKFDNHGLAFFRPESVANASLYLLRRFRRSQEK